MRGEPIPTLTRLADTGPALVAGGYKIVPIPPGGKYPRGVAGWETLDASAETVSGWCRSGMADHGVGVLARTTPAVDIDVMDAAFVSAFVAWVRDRFGWSPARVGQAPKALLPYRAEAPFSKAMSAAYRLPDGSRARVEILGSGQQWVAFAQHPNTQAPYQWVDGASALDIPASELPALTAADAAEICAEFDRRAAAAGWERWAQDAGGIAPKPVGAGASDPLANAAAPLVIDEARIREALLQVEHLAADYDTWIRVGMALHHQSSGADAGLCLWDGWSATASNYDAGAVRDKWDSFGRSGFSRPVITFASVLAEAKQAQRDDVGGYTAWREQWAYLEESDRYVRLDTGGMLKPAAWRTTNQRFFDTIDGPRGGTKRAQWCDLWNDDAASLRCRRAVLAPGEGQCTPDGHLNLWRAHPAQTLAEEGDADGEAARMFSALVDHLCRGRADVVSDLLGWAANGLFQPERRLRWAPYLISRHRGTGKSMFTHILGALYGHEFSSHPRDLRALCGQFNAVIDNKMLVAVQEAVDPGDPRGAWTAFEAIKGLISEGRGTIERKGIDAFDAPIPARFIFCSNKLDGMRIDPEERRLFVINMGDTDPMADAFYSRLGALSETRQGLADIAAFLAAHVRGEGLPIRAPEGDMADVMRAFDPDWALDLVEDFGGKGLALPAAEIVDYATRAMGRPVTSTAVGKRMAALGWRNMRKVVAGQRVRVWTDAAGEPEIGSVFATGFQNSDA